MKNKNQFGDKMDITNFQDVAKFMGKVNKVVYGIDTYKDLEDHDCGLVDPDGSCDNPVHDRDLIESKNL